MAGETKDPYIGEAYQDMDSRSFYRVVHIIGFDTAKQKYIGVQKDRNGRAVSTRHYKAETLDNRYRKVSH